MADEPGLPRSTLQKWIKEALPPDMRVAGEATDLIIQCCNEFVQLISSQANEISEKDKKSTILPDHVVRALEELGFAPFLDDVKAVLAEWKEDRKEHARAARERSQGQEPNLSQEQLAELQARLFEEARARTLPGPLQATGPSPAAAGPSAAAEAPAPRAAEPPAQAAAAPAAEPAPAAAEPQQPELEQQAAPPGAGA